MKKQKKEIVVNYLAYVDERSIDNLYEMFRATPWSFTHYEAHALQKEIETLDRQLGRL